MHSPRPIEPTRSQLAVSESGGCQVPEPQLGRIDAQICSAILSSCTSSAKRGCGVPWPRLGPQGGLLVNARAPWKR